MFRSVTGNIIYFIFINILLQPLLCNVNQRFKITISESFSRFFCLFLNLLYFHFFWIVDFSQKSYIYYLAIPCMICPFELWGVLLITSSRISYFSLIDSKSCKIPVKLTYRIHKIPTDLIISPTICMSYRISCRNNVTLMDRGVGIAGKSLFHCKGAAYFHSYGKSFSWNSEASFLWKGERKSPVMLSILSRTLWTRIVGGLYRSDLELLTVSRQAIAAG